MEVDRNTEPDFDFLENGRGRRNHFLRPAFLSKVFIAILGLVLFILLIVAMSSGKTDEINLSDCLYPLGGGAQIGGHLDSNGRLSSNRCRRALDTYTKNKNAQYWKDTATTTDAAIEHIGRISVANYSKMLIFDIDETALSNLEEIKQTGFGTRDAKAWTSWVQEARAPAIPGSLDLFKKARDRGFSVTFLTGRREYERKDTERNLQGSGFGTACLDKSPVQGKDCYHSLILRQNDDNQDAVLYKSKARGNLVSKNFTIVLSIGDQWSDLLGEHRPEGVFKMPNPFYYLP